MTSDRMKILSVRQPWAWSMFHAGKDIENRSWTTTVRGRVLIHASQRIPREMDRAEFWATVRGAHPHDRADVLIRASHDARCGGIVGSVEIVDCVSESESPWFFGPFGFVLRAPRLLPFIPLKGRLGFWDAPDEVMAKVREAA